MRAPQFIKRMNPPEMIIFGFLSVILIGSIFLALPISDQNGQATSYLDSLFMAVSATCVTGLVLSIQQIIGITWDKWWFSSWSKLAA